MKTTETLADFDLAAENALVESIRQSLRRREATTWTTASGSTVITAGDLDADAIAVLRRKRAASGRRISCCHNPQWRGGECQNCGMESWEREEILRGEKDAAGDERELLLMGVTADANPWADESSSAARTDAANPSRVSLEHVTHYCDAPECPGFPRDAVHWRTSPSGTDPGGGPDCTGIRKS